MSEGIVKNKGLVCFASTGEQSTDGWLTKTCIDGLKQKPPDEKLQEPRSVILINPMER